jgi:hypothetical protein
MTCPIVINRQVCSDRFCLNVDGMRSSLLSPLIFAWVTGCGGAQPSSQDASADDAASSPDVHKTPPEAGPDDAAAIDSGPVTYDFGFGVADWFHYTAVAGVEICVMDHPEVTCQTTSAQGKTYLTGVPAGNITLSFTKSGYVPATIAFVSDLLVGGNAFGLIASQADLTSDLGGQIDLNRGWVVSGTVPQPSKKSYSIALTPAVGTPLTGATLVALADVPAGDAYGHVTGCAFESFASWPATSSADFHVKVYAGYIAEIGIGCQ